MATPSKLTRQTSWRDNSVPFTEEELLNLRNVVLPSLPTFKDNKISSSDIGLLCNKLKVQRSPEFKKVYQSYWDFYTNGTATVENLVNLASKFHNTSEWFREILKIADADHDGFISKSEYKIAIEMLNLHAEDWFQKTYKDFVEEVDANEDGKISIEECMVWIEENAPKYDE